MKISLIWVLTNNKQWKVLGMKHMKPTMKTKTVIYRIHEKNTWGHDRKCSNVSLTSLIYYNKHITICITNEFVHGGGQTDLNLKRGLLVTVFYENAHMLHVYDSFISQPETGLRRHTSTVAWRWRLMSVYESVEK